MYIEKNILISDKESGERPIQWVEAADKGGFLEDPKFIVLHYTAGIKTESDLRVLTRDDNIYVSCHFIIGRNGAVYQTVLLNRQAWHAGKSQWGEYIGLNKYSIGIEFVNSGWYNKKEGDYWYRDNLRIREKDTISSAHRNDPNRTLMVWEKYTPIQIDYGIRVCKALIKAYPSIEEILGHDDIAPKRKQDPGPAFPMKSFMDRVWEVEEVKKEKKKCKDRLAELWKGI